MFQDSLIYCEKVHKKNCENFFYRCANCLLHIRYLFLFLFQSLSKLKIKQCQKKVTLNHAEPSEVKNLASPVRIYGCDIDKHLRTIVNLEAILQEVCRKFC